MLPEQPQPECVQIIVLLKPVSVSLVKDCPSVVPRDGQIHPGDLAFFCCWFWLLPLLWLDVGESPEKPWQCSRSALVHILSVAAGF